MNLRRPGGPYALLVVCLLASCVLFRAQGQEPSSVPSGTTLRHFAQVDREVFVGSKPHTDQDFQFLQSEHIQYILNVRFLPFLSGPEKRKAKRYGMSFLSFPMNASPIPPSEKHVNQILLAMKDKRFEPV
jgi:hypothetical protein